MPRWLPAFVLGVAALAFLPTLGGGFLGDDFVYIARFRELPWAEWPRLFTQDWSGGVWGQQLRELRPFAALSFMGDARAFGGNALGYRLTNLALHLISTLLVFRLAWHYSAGRMAAALVAGVIFAVHPAHAEAVSWITGRVDLLATAAALLFWLAAELFGEKGRAGRLALALVAFVIGIFSKEFCMFAPLLLVLRWVLLDLRAARAIWLRRAALFGGALVVFAIYAACRRAAFGSDHIGYNLWTDEPAWHRQAGYAGWLAPLLPFTSHSEWKTFSSLKTLHAVWLTFATLTVAGLATAIWRRAHTAAAVLFFGGLWYLITVFPLTAVVYLSPRHLYFPTVGLALAAGLACAAIQNRAARTGLSALLIAWCVAGHVAAVKPWRRAASVSREALAALDRDLALAGPAALALTSVPETLGPTWLWAWSSPQCYRAPFLAHPPRSFIERPINYSRSDHWLADRKPLETVRAAPEAVVLFADPEGRISHRRVPGPELQRRSEGLARIMAGGITQESWSDWVRALARPEPAERAQP